MRFTLSVLLFAGALALSACGERRVSVVPQPPSPVSLLQRDLSVIFDDPEFRRSNWSVLVRPLASDDNLFELNAGKLVMPGSNMKILTLAAAADLLGWDYRFETKMVSSAPLDAGVLRGDLIVIGSGDPTISERGDENGVLPSMARQLAAAGVRRIEGRIVGDDDTFDDRPFGDGWTLDNLPYGYAAPVSALEYNEGSVDLVIRAGETAGDPVELKVRPEGSELQVDNRLSTVAEDGAGVLTLSRLPGSTRLTVDGRIPAKAETFARTASVDNPTRFFVNAFRAALVGEGIQVDGEAIDVDDLAVKPDRWAARTIASRLSPPLSQMAASMMKVSQNQYAELLLRAIAVATRSAVGPMTISTVEAGRRLEHDRLLALGIPDDSFIIADGSGLSRYNYVTEDALVRILQIFYERPAGTKAFPASLSVVGRDGTLARRLAGTPAEGRVRAKSGTIDNVRAISGYVEDADGETLVFSIIANNYGIPTARIDAAVDRALLRLAAFRR